MLKNKISEKPNAGALWHLPHSGWAYAVSAEEYRIRFRTAKDDVDGVELILYYKYHRDKGPSVFHMTKGFSDGLFDYYGVRLKLSDSHILYLFRIRKGNTVCYYTENGVSEDDDERFYTYFQCPGINEADVHRKPAWCDKAVFYQIFVERFRRGDFEKNDGYINAEWSALPQKNGFHGGDIEGIRKSLDYIKELGADCLYLTPVFSAPSNHKYDTVDYFTVDPIFGTKTALKALTEDAHKKGMRIILDAVFNHSGFYAPEFRDVVAKGRNSPYFEWFIVHGDSVDTVNVNYESFADMGRMPKWNTGNIAVQDYLLSVTEKWMRECDIDGWRLDVADEISHVFWRRFRTLVKSIRSDALIIGEVWYDASGWLKGDEFDSVMNYPFLAACRNYFVFGKDDAEAFADKLSSLLMKNTDTVNGMMLNLLGSHDTERFFTSVNGNVGKMRCAMAVMFFYPGMPCIYYGDETGMTGGSDPDCRRGFVWEESEWNRELLITVKMLSGLKRDFLDDEVKIGSRGDIFITERAPYTLLVNNTTDEKTDSKTGTVLPACSFCVLKSDRK